MSLLEKHLDVLRDAHNLLRETEAKLANLLSDPDNVAYEDFDDMCDTLNTAAARLRYVRVFIEPMPDDEDLDRTLS